MHLCITRFPNKLLLQPGINFSHRRANDITSAQHTLFSDNKWRIQYVNFLKLFLPYNLKNRNSNKMIDPQTSTSLCFWCIKRVSKALMSHVSASWSTLTFAQRDRCRQTKTGIQPFYLGLLHYDETTKFSLTSGMPMPRLFDVFYVKRTEKKLFGIFLPI